MPRARPRPAAEWADKANKLLAASKLNIADALAWQRDAAKAGAPLSKEPLSALKVQLAERVKTIEDLQHRVQVQREAAVLLAQRVEVLSTKSYLDAQAADAALATDVAHWQEQAAALEGDASWSSVEARYPTMLETSKSQLLVVWDAFQSPAANSRLPKTHKHRCPPSPCGPTKSALRVACRPRPNKPLPVQRPPPAAVAEPSAPSKPCRKR